MGTTTKQQKKVPELRFPDFHDIWNHKSVSGLFNVVVGFVGTVSTEYCSADVGVPFVRTLNVKDGYFSQDELQYVTKEFHNRNKKSQIFNGDILIARVGANMGFVSTVKGLRGEANSANVVIIKQSPHSVSEFYSYYLSSDEGKKQILAFGAGGAQEVLNIGEVKKIVVPAIDHLEQQKIADFLGSVDTWLNNLRQQKIALETYKRGMMQKLFTQQVRFKDDSGKDFPEWKQMTLADVSSKFNSGVAAGSLEGNEGEFAVFGASGLYKHVDFYQEEEPYIAVVKDGSGVGRTNVYPGKSSVIGTLNVIRAKQGYELYFVYLLILQLNLQKYVIGGAIPHIYYKDYKREKVMVPSLAEQQKISEFILSLEQSVTTKTEEIAKVEQWKKGLMQKMFV